MLRMIDAVPQSTNSSARASVDAPKRVLYYCQSLVGVGHLTCSLRVIERLLEHCEVDLIQGGLDSAEGLEHPRYRNLRLHTLLQDNENGEFFDPEHRHSVEEIWAMRKAATDRFLRVPYHAIMVEFYPFGRLRFTPEITGIFRTVRKYCGPVPIFTSVREVLVPHTLEDERRMLELVREHIHTVFVRGDPEIVRFDETFSLAPEIADKLCYTGYVAPAPVRNPPPRAKQILVSQGGGNVGRELLDAVICTAALLPEYSFLLAAGSRSSPRELDEMRRSVRSANVRITPFLSNFQSHLMASALSINMGGDNTLIEALAARTPVLAYAYTENPEQSIRIAKFARKGLLHELRGEDLSPPRLKDMIERALRSPYPAGAVALDGAAVTSERIRDVLVQAAGPR